MGDSKAKMEDSLVTRTGGAYIPPMKLKMMMQQQIAEKSGAGYQRLSWEALKKSIHGFVNKVNTPNIANVVRELFGENLIRGRGLLVRSLIQCQTFSPTYTNVFASLVAVINTKFPAIGELLVKRLVIQFRKGYKRRDKNLCLTSTRFVAHLVNQQVAHELLALEILMLLLEQPTDDSVEVAISFLKECGARLKIVSPRGLVAITDRMRAVLHEATIDPRTQYMIEVLFAVIKDNFKDHPTVLPELDLVEEGDQFTHMIALDDDISEDRELDVFKYDPDFLDNEAKYEEIKREIVGDDDGEEGGEDGEGEEGEGEEGEGGEEEGGDQAIIDNTEVNMVNLRRTIYLAIQSSLNFEEAAHKLMKMTLKPEQEQELCYMIVDCCAQLRTYEKFYGLLAERFCKINQKYVEHFEKIFKDQYETCHRLELMKLRNVAKVFAHMLFSDAINWTVMSCIQLTEETTTSSGRIFIKILFQELAEHMGVVKLNERFQDPTLKASFVGVFPTDSPKNIRFAINFFTAIGLGGLTDELRDVLKSSQKPTAQLQQRIDQLATISAQASAVLPPRGAVKQEKEAREEKKPKKEKKKEKHRQRSSSSSVSEPETNKRTKSKHQKDAVHVVKLEKVSVERELGPPSGRRRRSVSRSPSPPPRRRDAVRRSPSPTQQRRKAASPPSPVPPPPPRDRHEDKRARRSPPPAAAAAKRPDQRRQRSPSPRREEVRRASPPPRHQPVQSRSRSPSPVGRRGENNARNRASPPDARARGRGRAERSASPSPPPQYKDKLVNKSRDGDNRQLQKSDSRKGRERSRSASPPARGARASNRSTSPEQRRQDRKANRSPVPSPDHRRAHSSSSSRSASPPPRVDRKARRSPSPDNRRNRDRVPVTRGTRSRSSSASATSPVARRNNEQRDRRDVSNGNRCAEPSRSRSPQQRVMPSPPSNRRPPSPKPREDPRFDDNQGRRARPRWDVPPRAGQRSPPPPPPTVPPPPAREIKNRRSRSRSQSSSPPSRSVPRSHSPTAYQRRREEQHPPARGRAERSNSPPSRGRDARGRRSPVPERSQGRERRRSSGGHSPVPQVKSEPVEHREREDDRRFSRQRRDSPPPPRPRDRERVSPQRKNNDEENRQNRQRAHEKDNREQVKPKRARHESSSSASSETSSSSSSSSGSSSDSSSSSSSASD